MRQHLGPNTHMQQVKFCCIHAASFLVLASCGVRDPNASSSAVGVSGSVGASSTDVAEEAPSDRESSFDTATPDISVAATVASDAIADSDVIFSGCAKWVPAFYDPGDLPRHARKSTQQTCLCYPRGDQCLDPEHPYDANTVYYEDPTMRCPDGEVCDGGPGRKFGDPKSVRPQRGAACFQPCDAPGSDVVVGKACAVGESCMLSSLLLSSGIDPQIEVTIGICVREQGNYWEFTGCPNGDPPEGFDPSPPQQ